MSVVFQIDASAAEGVKKGLGELQAKTPQVLKNAINSTLYGQKSQIQQGDNDKKCDCQIHDGDNHSQGRTNGAQRLQDKPGNASGKAKARQEHPCKGLQFEPAEAVGEKRNQGICDKIPKRSRFSRSEADEKETADQGSFFNINPAHDRQRGKSDGSNYAGYPARLRR